MNKIQLLLVAGLALVAVLMVASPMVTADPVVTSRGGTVASSGPEVAVPVGQTECRFLCEDGHDGVLACPAGTPINVCKDLLGDVCAEHGGMMALFCYVWPD
ncbi:MAG: hypothetical protein AAF604_00950 [Acidobacteriota bacterium]